MSLKNSLRLLFLMVCAIHLIECQYFEESDDYSGDYYPPLLRKGNKQKEKKENTGDTNKPPKDFFIPSVSFVPYSQMKTKMIRHIDETQKPAQKGKGKKKPCTKKHHEDTHGDYDGNDYDDTQDDYGGHTRSYGGRKRRSHGGPMVRTHHSQDSRIRHSNIPRIREVINKYTIDMVENTP